MVEKFVGVLKKTEKHENRQKFIFFSKIAQVPELHPKKSLPKKSFSNRLLLILLKISIEHDAHSNSKWNSSNEHLNPIVDHEHRKRHEEEDDCPEEIKSM